MNTEVLPLGGGGTGPLGPAGSGKTPLRPEAPEILEVLKHDGSLIQPRAPTSNTDFAAGLMEPLVAIACLLGCTLWFDGAIDRASLLLAALTLIAGYPGVNRFHHRARRAVFDLAMAWATRVALFLACGWLSDSLGFFDPSALLAWVLLTPVLQAVGVLGGQVAMRAHFRRPEEQRPTLVIGAGEPGVRVAEMLEQRWNYGIRFLGYLEDRQVERQHAQARGRVLGSFDSLADQIRANGVRDVYITLPLSMQPRIRKLLAQVQDEAVSIFLVPDVFGTRVIRGRVHDLDGIPVVGLLEAPFDGVNGLVKRLSDLLLATVALVVLAPLWLGIAVGVRLSSPGPILIRQTRHGMNGREITVYKFRTTTWPAAAPGQPAPPRRLTRLGAWLRRHALDQLPQFLNVLQGRMSVVGPRPHPVAHHAIYQQMTPAYMVRHKVKPGITGWAQVNGVRGEAESDVKMVERVALDLDYLRMWTPGLDLRIIGRTVRLLLGVREAA